MLDLLLSTATARKLRMRRDEAIALIQRVGLRRGAQIAARALAEPEAAPGELSGWQREVLAAVLDRMCRYEDPELPAPSQTGALEAAIEFTRTMPQTTRQKLYDLLAVFEAGPAALGPQRRRRRFSAMDPEAQDAYLQMWERSAIEPMRAGFHGLKSTCMMGYWSQPPTWGAIGYGLDTEGGYTGAGQEE